MPLRGHQLRALRHHPLRDAPRRAVRDPQHQRAQQPPAQRWAAIVKLIESLRDDGEEVPLRVRIEKSLDHILQCMLALESVTWVIPGSGEQVVGTLVKSLAFLAEYFREYDFRDGEGKPPNHWRWSRVVDGAEIETRCLYLVLHIDDVRPRTKLMKYEAHA